MAADKITELFARMVWGGPNNNSNKTECNESFYVFFTFSDKKIAFV